MVDAGRGRFVHSHGYVLDFLVVVPERVTSPYLHVLFHGFSRIESHVPPVFARRQWRESANSVCLLVSDPIHNYTKESACGWFLLGEDEFMPRLLALRQELLDQHDLAGTVWHGLSSGGYAALRYCARAAAGDLAFVIAPHDDPTILPQWRRELAPFQHLASMGEPTPTTRLLETWPRSGNYLYAVITELDSYFALEHLRPIMASLGGHPSARAVVLRDGRGHGFIANDDYDARLAEAVAAWRSYRGSRAGESMVRA